MARYLDPHDVQARMLAEGADLYPACTRMRLAFRSVDAARKRKAREVWQVAIARLGKGADPELLLYALADGVTAGPHGVPWR